jgi:hypothetical protein
MRGLLLVFVFVGLSFARISVSKDGTLSVAALGSVTIDGDLEVQGRSLNDEINAIRNKIAQANALSLNWLPTLIYQNFGSSRGANFFSFGNTQYLLVADGLNTIYRFDDTSKRFTPIGRINSTGTTSQFETFKMDSDIFAIESNPTSSTQLYKFVQPNFEPTGETLTAATSWKYFEINSTKFLAQGTSTSKLNTIFRRESNNFAPIYSTTILDEVKDWVPFFDGDKNYVVAVGAANQSEILVFNGISWNSTGVFGTSKAYSGGTFQIGKSTYLVIGQQSSTSVFLWQNQNFVEISQIPSEIPVNIQIFTVSNIPHLFIANQNSVGTVFPRLYAWKSGKFQQISQIVSRQNFGGKFFQMAGKDFLYLAATNSSLYRLGIV